MLFKKDTENSLSRQDPKLLKATLAGRGGVCMEAAGLSLWVGGGGREGVGEGGGGEGVWEVGGGGVVW